MAAPPAAASQAYAAPAPSAGEAVMEVTSRRVLWEREADRALPMASTTKILTALIVTQDSEQVGPSYRLPE